jgi:flagellar basal body-associated protein FliL
MKTSQRGSVLSIVIIIIVVLILIMGGLFFITSSSLNSARSQKVQTSTNTDQSQVAPLENQNGNKITYTEPSGLFSFTYPSDLEITKYTPTNGLSAILSQRPFLVNISQQTTQGTNKFDIEVDLDESLAVNFEKASQMKGSSNFSKENVTIGNVNGYRMYYESVIFGKTVKEVRYVFPLTYNNSKVFLYEKIDAWDSTWLSKAEPIAKSIKIDVTKTPQAVDKLKNSPVVQGM